MKNTEQKRKIIGAAFIDVFEEEAAKIGGAEFFVAHRPCCVLTERDILVVVVCFKKLESQVLLCVVEYTKSVSL